MRLGLVLGVLALASCGRLGFGTGGDGGGGGGGGGDGGGGGGDGGGNADAPPQQMFPSGARLRSIGTHAGALYAQGQLSIALGSTTVTLTGGTWPDNVGPGDSLVIGGEQFFVGSHDSATVLTVQAAAAAAHTLDGTYQLQRAYAAPQTWADAVGGNLVADNRLEIGVMYPDSTFTSAAANIVTLSGNTTDATHYLRLTAISGHRGVPGGGVVLDCANKTTGVMTSDPYDHVDNVELANCSSETATLRSVRVTAANVVLDSLLVHDFETTASTAYGVYVDTSAPAGVSFAITNSMFYSGDTAIRLDSSTATATVSNCTIATMQRSGTRVTSGAMLVQNSIALATGAAGFRLEGGTLTQTANLSADASATGTGSLANQAAASVLVGVTGDLHRLDQSPAADAGITLPFCCDIDGQARPIGAAWDIGADER